MERKQKKKIELLKVYTMGDMAYIEGKRVMTHKDTMVLLGILTEFCEFLKTRPMKGENKKCLM